jgi:GH15 family glucan-1,4-alpha-glucosidase
MPAFNKNKLIATSVKVFEDCLLPNGALVAAPTHQPYYPKEASNYLYVWPGRDSGFSLAAMLLVGKDYYEPVLRWIWERAEDFQSSADSSHEGILFRNYFVNGRIYLHYFQPDQNGTLLWSIGFKAKLKKEPLSELERLVAQKAAEALVRIWEKDHFILPIEDLWEERSVKPTEGILTYSLASCAVGLKRAGELLNNNQFTQIAKEMRSVLDKYCWGEKENLIPRRFGGSLGEEVVADGSLSGLIWPFNTGFPKKHLEKMVKRLEQDIVTEFGVHRYPADSYEGALDGGHNHKNEQAGAWPLLTFWLSLAYAELGYKKKAEYYFDLVFEKTEDEYFPEQLFCCEAVPWEGVKPLLWSHAMALFAAWKLGKI